VVRVWLARGSFGQAALFFAAQAALFVSFGQSDRRSGKRNEGAHQIKSAKMVNTKQKILNILLTQQIGYENSEKYFTFFKYP
jgi:hypothetical protein